MWPLYGLAPRRTWEAHRLEDGYEGCERGGGDHVGWVLAGPEEDGHEDPGGLDRTVGVRAQGTADVLHDLDLEAAGVGERHRLNAPLADDVNAFAGHPDGGKRGPVYAEGQ